jgi:two-component system chemotaxis response regulator CheB
MPVRKGTVFIAPGGYHLIVEKKGMELVCKLTETPPVRSVRPSADVLFTSVSDVFGGNVIVLVLTGMGKDGLDGVKLLRDKGAYVIAESRETSVIFGMPGAIIGAGLADEVLPLYSIAESLERAVNIDKIH